VSTLDEWRRARAITTRNDFIALHPYAFLVSAPRPDTGEFMPLTKPTEFRTVTHKHELPPRRETQGPQEDSMLILPLCKADGHPFPERVSVGRAMNCDVVIRDPSVSKLHGHFRDVGAESAFFTDAKSSNGTRVDGAAAKAAELRARASDAGVRGGPVRLVVSSGIQVGGSVS